MRNKTKQSQKSEVSLWKDALPLLLHLYSVACLCARFWPCQKPAKTKTDSAHRLHRRHPCLAGVYSACLDNMLNTFLCAWQAAWLDFVLASFWQLFWDPIFIVIANCYWLLPRVKSNFHWNDFWAHNRNFCFLSFAMNYAKGQLARMLPGYWLTACSVCKCCSYIAAAASVIKSYWPINGFLVFANDTRERRLQTAN